MHVVAQVTIPPKFPDAAEVKKTTEFTRSPPVDAHVNEFVEESDLVTVTWKRPALLLALSDDKMMPPEGSNSPDGSIT